MNNLFITIISFFLSSVGDVDALDVVVVLGNGVLVMVFALGFLMEAIELEFDGGVELFPGQLEVGFVSVGYAVGRHLVVGIHPRELPVYYTYLIVITHQQIKSLEFLHC